MNRNCVKCQTEHARLGSNGSGRPKIEKWYRYGPDKSQWICKPCFRMENRSTTIYYRNVKLDVFKHYFGENYGCIDCGFKDIRALTLDHEEGGGNQQRIKLFGSSNTCGARFYAWLKTNGYPKLKLAPRCANCHIIIEQERIEAKYIK